MRHPLTLSVLLTLALFACSTPLETVRIPASVEGWVVAHAQDKAGTGNITEFIRGGQTLQNWSEMITIQFLENTKTSPADFMAQLEKAMRERVPSVNWKVIAGDEESILYEWQFSGVAKQPDQHEIARLLRGNDGLHRVAYTKRGAPLSSEGRMEWIGYLRGAAVFKDGKPIDLQ